MWLLLRTCPRRGHKEPEGLEEEDGLESGQGGTPVPEAGTIPGDGARARYVEPWE